jgi:tRNA(Ile)-lysidine synthase
MNMTLLKNIETVLSGCGISSSQTAEAPLAVALSGGADSVCLLLALKELGYTVHALHCNFELRGTESDADEAFCRRLCRQNDTPITVKHFRTKAFAQRRGISIEMAARELRYKWFDEQVKLLGAAALCVGHHRDDQAETILLNLVRGTGIRGLCGMQMRNERGIIRPMLNVSRSDIEQWLKERGQEWVTDSTNLDPEAAKRNTLRLEVVPALQRINSSATSNISQTALRMSEALKLYDYAVQTQRAVVERADAIDIAALRACIAPQTILYEILRERGFTAEQVSDIFEHLDGDSGHEWQSSKGRLLRDRGRLLWMQQGAKTDTVGRTSKQDQSERVVPLEGLFEAADGTRLLIRRQTIDYATFPIPREKQTACYDLEKLSLPLTIRTVREGDRIQPFGLEGTRLLSDMLTDLKLSVFEKERQLVVCSGDTIVWVVGRRVAAGFEVDENTRHVMTLTIL